MCGPRRPDCTAVRHPGDDESTARAPLPTDRRGQQAETSATSSTGGGGATFDGCGRLHAPAICKVGVIEAPPGRYSCKTTLRVGSRHSRRSRASPRQQRLPVGRTCRSLKDSRKRSQAGSQARPRLRWASLRRRGRDRKRATGPRPLHAGPSPPANALIHGLMSGGSHSCRSNVV